LCNAVDTPPLGTRSYQAWDQKTEADQRLPHLDWLSLFAQASELPVPIAMKNRQRPKSIQSHATPKGILMPGKARAITKQIKPTKTRPALLRGM